MKRRLSLTIFVGAMLLGALAYYVFRPPEALPEPAALSCYDFSRGAYVTLEPPPRAYGLGLSYASHVAEAAASFSATGSPPVFEKHPRGFVRSGTEVRLPSADELARAANSLEPGLGNTLQAEYESLDPLVDYEVEMGFVLLDDVDPASLDDPEFAPPLGFFIANDLSARTIAILGEGQTNRDAYWGASKSFPGFMPVADRAWVPEVPRPNTIPCVEIETRVNGEVRQRESTTELIYTPRQMLAFIHEAFPEAPLEAGTIVLTGTPAGVAMQTPRWKLRLAELLHLSRFRKLASKLGDREVFLQPADRVTVRGRGLGKVAVTVVP